KGERIFLQGEAGWTAFYILTTEDVLSLRRLQLQRPLPPEVKTEVEKEVAQLEQRLAGLKKTEADKTLGQMAHVSLAVARTGEGSARSLTRFLNMRGPDMAGQQMKNADDQTYHVPRGGLASHTNVDVMKAPLFEGELFGEMSCLYRTPRS